jgi:hypothetical protein
MGNAFWKSEEEFYEFYELKEILGRGSFAQVFRFDVLSERQIWNLR